jgi:DNA-binding NtrC family response regulator
VHNRRVNSIAGAGPTASTNQLAGPPGLAITQKEPETQGNLRNDELPKARVLVVEENAFVREEVMRMVDGQPDLFCCGEADSIGSTPAAVARCKPDVILMELRFKDGEAFGLMNTLALSQSRLAVLVLTQCDELLYAERALQAGARDT